jgi:hypothetical protein
LDKTARTSVPTSATRTTARGSAMSELEKERELFLKALNNAIAWQNRCVELYEILEMFCMDAEATYE